MPEVDDMQNAELKDIKKRLTALENRQVELQVQFADLMGRMDLIIKVGKYLVGAVAVGLGMDASTFMGDM